jgi:hypothetical protein
MMIMMMMVIMVAMMVVMEASIINSVSNISWKNSRTGIWLASILQK